VDIRIHILRAIILHNPIDCRKINTSRSDICAEQNGGLSLSELKVYGSSLCLLLPSMQLQYGNTHFESSERLVCKSDLLARREEYDDFVLLVSLEEAKEGVKLLLDRYLHVVMKKLHGCYRLKLLSKGLVFG
jgi:hypothetical protein